LLIADIKMPGNVKLEFVEKVADFAPDLPVILVTGYPTLSTAINAANSPVKAYLTKPISYEELRDNVERELQCTARTQNLMLIQDRMRWSVKQLEETLADANTSDRLEIHLELCRTIARTLSECVVGLAETWSDRMSTGGRGNVCVIAGCPAWERHCKVLREAVSLLQQTKARFKSKELAKVRELLDGLLENS
jgi:response regulator RpfG family c-di-GMP phosphodiesterase